VVSLASDAISLASDVIETVGDALSDIDLSFLVSPLGLLACASF